MRFGGLFNTRVWARIVFGLALGTLLVGIGRVGATGEPPLPPLPAAVQFVAPPRMARVPRPVTTTTVWAACYQTGGATVRVGDPGYRGDGVACDN